MVVCSLPFAHIEQQSFRELIRYIRPAADDRLPRSGDTVKNDLKQSYDCKQEFVKRELQNSLSSIHSVPDNWTSPNLLGVIGCTVQFATEDYGLQSLVVGIQELGDQHSGENMAEAIMEFIREYEIASKVFEISSCLHRRYHEQILFENVVVVVIEVAWRSHVVGVAARVKRHL